MNFFNDLSILIIHGGRNDKNKLQIFNDIYVLDLVTITYIRAYTYETIPKDRYEHSSFIFDNKLYIFGGIDEDRYIGSDFFLIDLSKLNNLWYLDLNKLKYRKEKFNEKENLTIYNKNEQLRSNKNVDKFMKDKMPSNIRSSKNVEKFNTVLILKDDHDLQLQRNANSLAVVNFKRSKRDLSTFQVLSKNKQDFVDNLRGKGVDFQEGKISRI